MPIDFAISLNSSPYSSNSESQSTSTLSCVTTLGTFAAKTKSGGGVYHFSTVAAEGAP